MEGPGFQSGGQYSGPAGLLIPSRNDFGEIVGYQVAPDDQNGSGKYKWISSSENPVAIEDQWPVFQGQTDRETSLAYLVDGALKAALTGMLMDVPSIGVPGARFCTSGTQLLRVLARIMPPTQDERLVVLCVDAGDVVNTSDMPTNLLGVSDFLRGHGYTVRFGWWGQVHKDTGLDIDERLIVQAEGGAQLDRITPDQFHQIVTEYTGKVPRRALSKSPNRCPLGRQRNRATNPGDHPAGPGGLSVREGQRMEVLQSLQPRARFVLDRSKPGSGKSWDITHADPSEFGAAQIVMVARRALDVGAEFGIQALRGKDGGRAFNESGRLVRAVVGTDPDDLVFGPNCQLAEKVESYLHKGMQLHSANICAGCPHRRECDLTEGNFKHDKKRTNTSAVYVCEPEGSRLANLLRR